MPLCQKCETKIKQYANYCSKCGAAVGFKKTSKKDFLGDKKNFIIQSLFESTDGSGCIKDLDMNVLAFFSIQKLGSLHVLKTKVTFLVWDRH